MTQETTVELAGIHQELKKINQRLDGNDQRFEKIDQRFEKIDQRFEKIDQRFDKQDDRLDSAFQVVHTSINKIAVDHYKKCISDDQKHAELKAMFDTIMHRTRDCESISPLKNKVESHDLRISNLEADYRK